MADPQAGKREWIGLGVLALACLLYAMDLTVLHLAVPRLSADLRPSSAQLLWIIDIYGFLVAGSLITMGTLGDRIGRRKLLMIGAGAFGAASVLASFSQTAEMLIASRALMGVAGATLAPGTLSLIFTMFPDQKQRSVAISVWIASFSAGGAVGPVLGGVLLEHFWWGSVFLLALPVMVLLLVLGPRVLPEYRDPDAGRLNIPGAALSLTAILAVIYGLKLAAQDGFGPGAIGSVAAGVALGAVFVRMQTGASDPIIDMSLFRIRSFTVSLVTYMLSIFVAFGYFLFIAQYLQLVLGMSPLEAGLWSLPSGAGFILGSLFAPRIVRTFRPPVIFAGGLGLAALGLATLTRLGEETSTLPVLVVASAMISVALSPVVTLATELVVGSAPPERAGVASGISETSAELGGALGIAILGSIGTALYRNGVADAIPPGLPADAVAAARDTLGGAVAMADRLPAGVVEAARDAFLSGMHIVAVIAAAVGVSVAVLAATVLREAPPGSNEHGTTDPVIVETA